MSIPTPVTIASTSRITEFVKVLMLVALLIGEGAIIVRMNPVPPDPTPIVGPVNPTPGPKPPPVPPQPPTPTPVDPTPAPGGGSQTLTIAAPGVYLLSVTVGNAKGNCWISLPTGGTFPVTVEAATAPGQ